ncbi:MAG: MFS transporter, partial [Actinomycetota bacterium]|nr:MFS transporter [Actinomycetota bacterium]
SGRLSDRVGRKSLVTTGYSLAAVGKVIVAAAGVWQVVLVGRVVDRVGKGVRGTPRDALLADDVPRRQLGRVYGFHRTADTAGAVIGPLLGLVALTATGGDVRAALWVAVVPAVLSVLLTLFIREHRRARKARPPRRPGDPDQGSARTRPPPLPRALWRVVVVLGVIALVNFPDALVLLRVSEVGFSASGVVAAYVLYNLSYTAVSFPAGLLSDRWPRSRVFALGLTCFAVGYTGLALADGGWVVLVLLVIYGGFNGFTDGVGKAWISGLVPAEVRGHAQGVFQGISGGAVLVAGLWAGLLWEVGPGDGQLPLLLSGIVGGLAAVGLWSAGGRLEPARAT